MSRITTTFTIVWLAMAGVGLAQPSLKSKADLEKFATTAFKESIEPFFREHCFKCHGNKKATAGLNLQTLKPDFLSDPVYLTWESIDERIRDNEMPPRPLGEAGRPDAPHILAGDGAAAAAVPIRLLIDSAAELRDVSRLKPDAKILESDDAATRLLKRKYVEAERIFKADIEVWEQGMANGSAATERVVVDQKQLLNTALDLTKDPTQRVNIHKLHLGIARKWERMNYERFVQQVEPSQSFYQAKYKRLDALLKLQRAIDAAKSPPKR